MPEIIEKTTRGSVRAMKSAGAIAVSAITALLLLLGPASAAGSVSPGWSTNVPFTNVVASSPCQGGGYPIPPGATAPEPGTCRLGYYNANESESWLAVRPGTEDLVGSSKFFFEKYSTFYDFHMAQTKGDENETPVGTIFASGSLVGRLPGSATAHSRSSAS